ncbi:hypothetical protein Acr_09g0005160 [Actinidia rufa]|uniref:Retrotransposon gag domain-containing protein n=1 Tax=Actinidia rufa TaxID=165716 RepID=A0A7J0F5W9_9ERIC|nr:hypothetical protein Acr_09g0005160 [Actinidia rufa]
MLIGGERCLLSGLVGLPCDPNRSSSESISSPLMISFHTYLSEDLAVISSHDTLFSIYKKAAPPSLKSLYSSWSDFYAGEVLSGLAPAGYDCSLVQLGAICGNDSSQLSMHLHSYLLYRPSTSSPLENRARPMANTSQVPDLEGLHREMHGIAEQIRITNENNALLIQHLTTNNPPPPTIAPIQEELDRSRHSCRSDDHKSSTPLEYRSSNETHDLYGEETRKHGRSLRRDDQAPKYRDKSTTRRSRTWMLGLTAINTGTSALVTVDALIRQTEPPFTERVMRTKISSKCKLPTQLKAFCRQFHELQGQEEECLPPLHSTPDGRESLKDYVKHFNQAVLEVEDASDKVVIMAMMEGFRSGSPFDSLSKNVPKRPSRHSRVKPTNTSP